MRDRRVHNLCAAHHPVGKRKELCLERGGSMAHGAVGIRPDRTQVQARHVWTRHAAHQVSLTLTCRMRTRPKPCFVLESLLCAANHARPSGVRLVSSSLE